MFSQQILDLIAESYDLHYKTTPWEGVPYIKRELKGMSGKLSVDNKKLMDYVYDGPNRALAMCIVRCMVLSDINQHLDGVNPILQDHLANTMQFEFNKFLKTEIQKPDPSLRETDQENAIARMAGVLYKAKNHREIGERLGLPGKWLGVYDVLMEYYSESFEPTVVDMARELCQWIFGDHGSQSRQSLMRELVDRVHALMQKYDVSFSDEGMVYQYLGMEITNWYRMTDEFTYDEPTEDKDDW